MVENIKYIAIGLFTAIALNYISGFILGTDLPYVAVVSESMTHDQTTETNHYQFLMNKYGFTREQIDSFSINNGFRKGDVLIVRGIDTDNIVIGDVIVYDIPNQRVPVVHRVIDLNNGILTKGDHNPGEDNWKPIKIHGKAIFVIPLLGWPKLLLTELLSVVF